MIKEPAMLIMGNDKQRAIPLCWVFGEYLVDIPQKMFSSPDSRGRMVVIGCPAKMDGRIGILGLDEYYLRHFRHRLGCHIPGNCLKLRKFGPSTSSNRSNNAKKEIPQ